MITVVHPPEEDRKATSWKATGWRHAFQHSNSQTAFDLVDPENLSMSINNTEPFLSCWTA